MTPGDFAVLAPHLDYVRLPKRFEIVAAGGLIEHVYFIETGIASVMTISPDGFDTKTGLFGREGMGPTSRVLGSDRSVQRIVVPLGDEAYRIEGETFSKLLDERGSLRQLLQRYVLVMSVQTSYTALSNAVHSVNERLARWLLMCHDRVDSDEIPLTHETLALMLAVRRPTVTSSLHVLEGNGLIWSERGYVTIRNRKALEDFAANAYGRPEAEYVRLIGPMN